MPNRFTNKWGSAFIRWIGVAVFTYRAFKKWEYEWWIELLILVFFAIVAMYPSRIKVMFDKGFGQIKKKVSKNLETGGDGTDENDEV